MADYSATVVSTGDDRFAYDISSGGFTLASGTDASGDRTGPGPFHFLATSLGTCTSINVQGFANKRGLPLERLEVTVTIERTTDRNADVEQHWNVTTEIALFGPLSDEQRQALFHAAEDCSVRKFFMGRQTVVEKLVARSDAEAVTAD